jgi:hypothetical protein
MRREELTKEDTARILAGSIRNNVTTSTIFSPYHSLDLTIRDGQLCRTNTSLGHFDRGFAPIASLDELLAMSDEEIFRRITGER